MPFKLNLRFFVFYVASFGIGIGIFQLVTHYGNTQLQAPQRIAGHYQLTTIEPPACIPPAGMVLDILQSGVYLNGSLLLANQTPQTGEGGERADTRPPLSGQWQREQLVLSGDAPSFVQCALGSIEGWFTQGNQSGWGGAVASLRPQPGLRMPQVRQGLSQDLLGGLLFAQLVPVSPALGDRAVVNHQRSTVPLKIIAGVSRFTNHSKPDPAQAISNALPVERKLATLITAEITGRILINPDSPNPVVIKFTGKRWGADQPKTGIH